MARECVWEGEGKREEIGMVRGRRAEREKEARR
jgi:hypothetical protein